MATLTIDENRYLIKIASLENITGKWKEVVDATVEACKDHLGDKLVSVYVGGSIAHGEAKDMKSDVDLYAITKLTEEETKENNNSWVKTEQIRLDALFPFQRGVAINLFCVDKLPEGKKFQMKVFATWVYGKDFDNELPPIRLDKKTFNRIRLSMQEDMDIARKDLAATDDVKKINKVAVSIAKRLIRSAGMMCMWKEDFYTMEIDKLVKMFISHYPSKEKEMNELFEFTKNPPSDKKEVLAMFDSFGNWLIEEDKRVFNTF